MTGPRVKLHGEIVEIDGKRYTYVRHHKDGSLIMREIDAVKQDELIAKLAKKFIKFVDREEVIKTALSDLSPNALQRIDRKLKKKVKPKKRNGCIEIGVGEYDVVMIRG